jgi:hypothetical protein
LIDKRARAMTMMLLTRREDLLIEEVKDDIGLDYVVRFHTKGKEALREFGVQLHGVGTAFTKSQADTCLDSYLQQRKRYGPFLRPVCLFLFTMEDDGAWYTWVAEPMDSEDGKSLLRFCDEADSRQLNKKAFKDIIERVDLWHDALLPNLTMNGPGSRKHAKQ